MSVPVVHEMQLVIARLAALGKSNPAIAVAVGITEDMVKQHLTRLYRTLGVVDRPSMVAMLTALGWLEVEIALPPDGRGKPDMRVRIVPMAERHIELRRGRWNMLAVKSSLTCAEGDALEHTPQEG